MSNTPNTIPNTNPTSEKEKWINRDLLDKTVGKVVTFAENIPVIGEQLSKFWNKLGLNISLANLFDPLGIFNFLTGAGSWFRSTRYFYYYSQYAEEVNGSYLPDPIQTYASSAVAQNADISSSVIGAIQQGTGNKLKIYYQYAKLRYGNRYWDWTLTSKNADAVKGLVVNNNTIGNIVSVPEYFQVIHTDNTYEFGGTHYSWWVQQTYGLDEFNKSYQGINYDVIKPEQLPDGKWVIAVEDVPENEDREPNRLIVDTIPMEKSIGFTYWTNNGIGITELDREDNLHKEELEISNIPLEYPITIGSKNLVEVKTLWRNPYEDLPDNLMDDGSAPQTTQEEYLGFQVTYQKYATLLEVRDTPKKVNVYQIGWIVSAIPLNQEHFVWALEDDVTTNNQMYLSKLLEVKRNMQNRPIIEPELHSNNSKLFKLYPHIPLLEWKQGKDTARYLLPVLKKSDELVKLVEKLNELNETPEYEDSEPDAILDREQQKHKKQNPKGTYNNKPTSKRALDRKLNRAISQKRKLKVNKLVNASKEHSPSMLKRHINKMCELLGIDFDYLALNYVAEDNYGKGNPREQERLIMPAVKFSSDLKEVQNYLWHFFNRLYNEYGRENQYQNWLSAVDGATSLDDLPINELKWMNQSSFDWGGMSWLYITKFKMNGNVRKIKRKHRYKEVKRGKPIGIRSLSDLKTNPEPLRELADDKYYTTKNGVQHCIGGQQYGNGIFRDNLIGNTLSNFDYTFFAKQSGSNQIEVIAVAGLSFYTKLSEDFRYARAFHDLGLQYTRNKKKFIDNVQNPNVSDEIHRRQSRKYHHYNVIKHWGIIPLDYKTVINLGGSELERFAPRACLLYGFYFSEQKGKRKGVKPLIQVVGLVVSIVLGIITAPAGGAGGWTAAAITKAIIQSVVYAVITQIALKHLVIPLLKALGLKGIIALIVMIVILIVASMLGGTPSDTQSALPYASEVGKQTAVQSAQEATKATVQQTISEVIQQGITQGISQFTNMTGYQITSTMLDASFKAIGEIQKDEMNQLQSEMKSEQQAYNTAMSDLQEQIEAFRSEQADFDSKAVLNSLRLRFKMYEPDSFLTSNTTPDTFSSSLDYLSSFIDMKLNIDPTTFDPVKSLDFSFKPQI